MFDSRVIHGWRATCVRAPPTHFSLSRRWLSSDNTCSTSRTRQVRSLRAARYESHLSIVQRQDHSPRKGEMKVRVLLLRPHADVAQLEEVPVSETGDEGSNPSVGTSPQLNVTVVERHTHQLEVLGSLASVRVQVPPMTLTSTCSERR